MQTKSAQNSLETVINYHITEKCNFACHYCFAKYGLEDKFKMELHHDLSQVKLMLEDIYQHFQNGNAGNDVRINFAGGEPMILKKFPEIIEMAYAIGFKVSLITNASVLTDDFINKQARHLSVFGLSIDSFQEDTNQNIGRVTWSGKANKTAEIMQKIALIRKLNSEISIKLNTVVTHKNYDELMATEINRIAPDKWKIFEVLPNGNAGGKVSKQQFEHFICNHAETVDVPKFVEYNDDLLDSYLMIDPLGRFYQRQSVGHKNIFSAPIIMVGAKQALQQVTFDQHKFDQRYVSFS
ncbi:hypothetical protein AU255_09015 [Methyloprofundus sedimenti]|uniref:S-adenosylmethionine-dependent nucleotide dehydratase n=1 Tax=Methyloprofundus sedimenti TaxID=1420851 RepID=A0A1V8M8W1_9GAMM|nr:viperin family antiviral radical SAM protein [Methyloprofundus sedimenti]OQK17979.1 hypothetical protein AU255_09015 [Methyloprofundus sedimenti]